MARYEYKLIAGTLHLDTLNEQGLLGYEYVESLERSPGAPAIMLFKRLLDEPQLFVESKAAKKARKEDVVDVD